MKKYLLFLFLPIVAYGAQPLLDTVRVVTRPDGGVSIVHLLAEYCPGQQVTECLDRETAKAGLAGLPFVDMLSSALPSERSGRDKWTLQNGTVKVDPTKVTKEETVAEYQALYDAELEKQTPDTVQVARLARALEKIKAFDSLGTYGIVPPQKESEFAALATGARTTAPVFGSIGQRDNSSQDPWRMAPLVVLVVLAGAYTLRKIIN